MIINVNREKNTVTARYVETGNRDYWFYTLMNTLNNIDCYSMISEDIKEVIVDNVLDGRNTYHGVAKCHPVDTFSIHEGSRLAVKDLNNRFNKTKRLVIIEFERILKIQFEDAMDRAAKRY